MRPKTAQGGGYINIKMRSSLEGLRTHMALEGVTSLGAMTVKTKGCVITWGP